MIRAPALIKRSISKVNNAANFGQLAAFKLDAHNKDLVNKLLLTIYAWDDLNKKRTLRNHRRTAHFLTVLNKKSIRISDSYAPNEQIELRSCEMASD